MLPNQEQTKVYKIYFVIQKKLDFGMGVYVVGNIDGLGNWNIAHSLRLNWNKVKFISNQDNYWTGFLTINKTNIPSNVEFKYVVAPW